MLVLQFMVILSSLDKLGQLDVEIDEIALQEWGKKCKGCLCPEVRGYDIGSNLLIRLGIPFRSKESIGLARRGNLLTILGSTQEKPEGEEDDFSLEFIDYICPIKIPREYDPDSLSWSCGEDKYGPHVRILIPRKTNV